MRVYAWFFFFKQKTAYEMRISDWSSDVCSSDLVAAAAGTVADAAVARVRTLAGGLGINTDRCPWLVGTGPLFAVALACSADQYRLEDPMTDHDTAHEGGCTCRAVRYRLTAMPLFVHCCHCRWCQRETGSAFALNAMIETARVELLGGQPDTVDTPSCSGKGQKIVRCPRCR